MFQAAIITETEIVYNSPSSANSSLRENWVKHSRHLRKKKNVTLKCHTIYFRVHSCCTSLTHSIKEKIGTPQQTQCNYHILRVHYCQNVLCHCSRIRNKEMLIFTESARGGELGQGQDQEADQGHEEADQGQLLIQQSMVLFLPKIFFCYFITINFIFFTFQIPI